MTDREKLINLILKISDGKLIYGKEETINITENLGELIDRLLSGGVTVKEPQKPLTVEELSCETDMYWVENEDGCFPVLLWDKFYYFSYFSKLGTEQDVVLKNNDYGKTWRCWAEKPTDEERKAAEWEE